MVLGLGAQGRGVRVGQEPADAGQGALGGALLAGDDQDGMRPDRPQRGRDPGDQEWKVICAGCFVVSGSRSSGIAPGLAGGFRPEDHEIA